MSTQLQEELLDAQMKQALSFHEIEHCVRLLMSGKDYHVSQLREVTEKMQTAAFRLGSYCQEYLDLLPD